METYDVCVIGAGLIGSASAKYCAQSGVKTILIGPGEPEKKAYNSHDIFGAWYDEGRITRHLDADLVWLHLAAESIKRYRSIEDESGIRFFTENGILKLVDQDGDPRASQMMNLAEQYRVQFRTMNKGELEKRFPYFRIPDGMIGVYEESKAGTINPRRLVEAQLKLLAKQDGRWIDDVAVEVVRLDKDGGEAPLGVNFRIHTRSGRSFLANRILSCMGAFLNHYPILPRADLDVTYRTAIVSRIRVEPGVMLEKMTKGKGEAMPSFIFASRRGRKDDIFGLGEERKTKIDYEEREGGGLAFYGLAPIKYPDAHYYLKVGYDSGTGQKVLSDVKSVIEWFRSGPSRCLDVGRQISEMSGEFIRDLDTTKFEIDTCVWMETPTQRPYVGRMDRDFYVVTGDNGFAAKSSDELGRLGARLTMDDGKWPSDTVLTEDMFGVRYK